MKMSNIKAAAVAGFFMVAVLGTAGCGGGDTQSVVSSPAEGMWNGTTDGNRYAKGIFFNDGSFYLFYTAVASPAIAGFIQGESTAGSGTVTSSNAKDFNFSDGRGVSAVGVKGSYVSKQTLNGTATYGGSPGDTTFSTAYSSLYELTPTAAAVAGGYSGELRTAVGADTVNISISPGGVLQGVSAGGCQVTGVVLPKKKGNAYDVVLTFGPSPCVSALQTFTGIGIFESASQKLFAAAPNAARTEAVLFVGAKL